MTTMHGRLPSIALVALALLHAASAIALQTTTALPGVFVPQMHGQRSPTIIFFDDMEDGDNGWTHADNTAGAVARFHLATHLAYDGEYSWCCGYEDPSLIGGDGYGNDWDQLLYLPPIDLAGAAQPVLEFAYRTDTESEYDFARVEAEMGGAFVDISPGLAGEIAWSLHPPVAVGPAIYDDPLRLRFRFVSDAAWSDEDGGHDSDGGGFHVDNIRVYDSQGGATLFQEDCESGGLCTPAVPPASGDWWHLAQRSCAAYSGSQCWWCGDDGDTSLIPPNLDNSLTSPPIDVSSSSICTLRFLVHAEVPTDDGDFWTEEISTDGGMTWYMTGAWWGDFGQCSSWATHGINGIDLSPYLPGDVLMFRISMHTTDDGCGPGLIGSAGLMLDDTWVEDWTGSPVEHTSWGAIKAMYR
jgi:hypothetical protein